MNIVKRKTTGSPTGCTENNLSSYRIERKHHTSYKTMQKLTSINRSSVFALLSAHKRTPGRLMRGES